MAKKYRRKDKDGHEIVTSIYYGNGFSRTTPEGIAELLNGKTPEQHCAMHIAKKGKGSFETKSVEVDICNLPYSNYFHGEIMGREFEYYYDTCEEIEFTGTKNGKPTTVKELMELKGGERIAIRANQRVVWNVPSNGKLIDIVIGEDSVAFTVPKDSMFAVRISAYGVCDPDAEKYVIIGVNSKTFKPVEHEEPVYQMVIRSPQDIHDIIKVSSTEVAMAVKDEDERKRQARGVIDTILNRIYLEPSNNVRKVLNAKNQFSAISGKNGAYGSVQKMPDSKIKPWVAAYVEEYLIERTQNPNSSIGGNVNYLNPDPSAGVSKKNMEQWGNDVVAQAEASGLIFGEGKNKHYHGTVPGSKKAPKFIIVMPKDYKRKWSK